MKEYYTTGQVAGMFPAKMKMTARKVAQLFDDGELNGVRYSDGGRRRTIERRITPESLAAFMARNRQTKFRVSKSLELLVAKAKKNAIGDKQHGPLPTRNRRRPKTCYYFAGSRREPFWIGRTRARLIAG